MDHIVLDVEAANDPAEVGWNPGLINLACAVIWEHSAQQMRVYGHQDVDLLRTRIEKADRITGYNIWKFDLPVIYSLKNKNDRTTWLEGKVDDILVRIWNAPGSGGQYVKGRKADDICKATIGRCKSGDGSGMPSLWRQGYYARVIDYCINDVSIERDLGLFIDQNGHILDPVRGNAKLAIPPWTKPEPVTTNAPSPGLF